MAQNKEEEKKNIKAQEDSTNAKDNNKPKKKKERNDINEKELKLDLEQEIAEVIIYHYTNARAKNSEVKRFINYLRHCSKDNKSNNSFVNRAYGLYQYLIEQYSNFVELDKIMSVKYHSLTSKEHFFTTEVVKSAFFCYNIPQLKQRGLYLWLKDTLFLLKKPFIIASMLI